MPVPIHTCHIDVIQCHMAGLQADFWACHSSSIWGNKKKKKKKKKSLFGMLVEGNVGHVQVPEERVIFYDLSSFKIFLHRLPIGVTWGWI